jgi:hypothetical protein
VIALYPARNLLAANKGGPEEDERVGRTGDVRCIAFLAALRVTAAARRRTGGQDGAVGGYEGALRRSRRHRSGVVGCDEIEGDLFGADLEGGRIGPVCDGGHVGGEGKSH